MTQPSQHLAKENEADPSSSRPPKMDLRRLKEGKWKINKAVSKEKMLKLLEEWGWGSDRDD